MADLVQILSSGEISDVYLTNTANNNKVLQSVEIDTKISESQVDIVDLGFEPQDPAPAHAEGKMFYDGQEKALSYYNEDADITINLGREMMTRVYNSSSSETITNGMACRLEGYNDTEELPTVTPAIAHAIETAWIAGVATSDIPPLSVGYITEYGVVRGVNTENFSAGSTLFLSDITAGTYTSIPPNIASMVGQVLVQDAVNGSVLVRIENVITLPKAIGLMQAITDTYSLSSVWQAIDNFQISDSSGMVIDPAFGMIRTPRAGFYRVNSTFSVEVASSTNQTRTVYIRAFNLSAGTSATYTLPIPREELSVSGSFNIPVTANANDQFRLEISCIGTIAGVTFPTISFDIETIRFTA